jgi:hypothetical protein
MGRNLLLGAAGLVLLLILRWTEKAGHPLPKWLWVLILIPYLWMAARDDDEYSIFGDSQGSAAAVMLIGGIAAIALGCTSIALKGQGSLLEIFGFMLPAGVLMVVAALLMAFGRSK